MKVERLTIDHIGGETVARLDFADVDKPAFISTEDGNPSRGLGVYLGPSWEDDIASKPGAHGVVVRGSPSPRRDECPGNDREDPGTVVFFLATRMLVIIGRLGLRRG